jgi:hypothetical protein
LVVVITALVGKHMPIFEESHLPPGVPVEVLYGVNIVVAGLRSRLVKEIVLPEGPLGLRVPNLVRGYLQAHLRRMLTFLDGGHAEYLAGRPLMAELATRAIYENVANLCDFTDNLKPLCEAFDYDGIEKHVTKAAFVTRIPSFLARHGDEDLKAPNILNQIDRMTKRYTEFRETYDHLSDIVHPNGLGAVVYFAKMTDGLMSFVDDAVTPERTMHSLFGAAFLLAFVEVELAAAESALKNVGAVVTLAHCVAEADKAVTKPSEEA